MQRVPYPDLQHRIEQVLLQLGLQPARAALGARLTAETDRDGVRTHGLARLPRFAAMVQAGHIDPLAEPQRVTAAGALERWRGGRGPGNLAAWAMMQRAMQLAHQHGIGCVALADTSHWMRAGTYGWQAAEAGLAALCWSNTLPNLPPWGATTPALGNNPLVIAVPGDPPIVLDMAMSQFSYGALAKYAAKGEALPVPGGYDAHGQLTTDAAAIEATQRALPVGYWKGSGLAIMLDLLAAMLSGGLATHDLPPDPEREVGQSQIFLAVAAQALSTQQELRHIAAGVLQSLHAAQPVVPGQPPRAPGEGVLAAREESLRLGVAVEDAAWEAFTHLEQQLGHPA